MMPKERMSMALNLKQPDVVPIAPYVGGEYVSRISGLRVSDYVLGDIRLRARALLNSYKYHKYDWIFADMNEPRGWKKRVRIEDHGDRYVVVPRRAGHSFLRDDQRTSAWVVPKNGLAPQHVVGDLKVDDAEDQLSHIRDCDSILRAGRCDVIKLLSKRVGKEVLLVAEVGDAFGMACVMLGLTEALTALYRKPNTMKRILELINIQCVETAKAMVDAGTQALWLCTVFSGTDTISPKQFNEFALPYVLSEIAQLARLGVPVVLYFCGDPMPILHDILSCGADAYAFEENKKTIQVDLVRIKESVEGKACVFGNFDAVHTLRGHPSVIERSVREMIEKVACSGGFIMGTGSPVMYDTPPGNLDAMIMATRRFGRYPIRSADRISS
jgi:hypothetical protein